MTNNVIFEGSRDRRLPTGRQSDSGVYAVVQPSSIPGFVVKRCHKAKSDAYPLWVWLVLNRHCSGPFDPYIQAVRVSRDGKVFEVVMQELSPQSEENYKDKWRTHGPLDADSMYEKLATKKATCLFADFSYLSNRFGVDLYCDLHEGNWMERRDGGKVATDPLVYTGSERPEWERVFRDFERLTEKYPDVVTIVGEEQEDTAPAETTSRAGFGEMQKVIGGVNQTGPEAMMYEHRWMMQGVRPLRNPSPVFGITGKDMV